MLVWLASYPRSGNTFLRIVLHQVYGVRTSVIYDIDGVGERLGPDFIGSEERLGSLAAMRTSEKLYFVKTHRQRDEDIDAADRAICLVRDGRDALVSWAHQLSEQPDRDFRTELTRLTEPETPTGTGSWGHAVLSWLRPPAPCRVVLRYEDLTRDPLGEVDRVVAALGLRLQPAGDATIPSFAELHRTDPQFFRRGHTGTHLDELPADLHRRWCSLPDNVEAMAALGYLAAT